MRRALVLIGLFSLVGCGHSDDGPVSEPVEISSSSGSSPSGAPAAPAAPAPIPAGLVPAPAHDETAPTEFRVVLDTTKGEIEMIVHRDWAPLGADRFYTLVKRGYFTDVAFFRVISGFMAQVGIHGDPRVNAAWRDARIADDPVREHNVRGRVSFATSGPNSRTTQFFINFADNRQLDGMGFAPFAEVRDMSVVDRLYAGYGEGAPRGRGPSQGDMQEIGNSYLRQGFPSLDYIRSARVVE